MKNIIIDMKVTLINENILAFWNFTPKLIFYEFYKDLIEIELSSILLDFAFITMVVSLEEGKYVGIITNKKEIIILDYKL